MESEKKNERTGNKVRIYSLIKTYFTKEICLELDKITSMSCDNNQKCVYIRELLRENNIPFSGLGPGTNRYGINMPSTIGMVAVKIALDSDGMIDNQREFKYVMHLKKKSVCKAYECLPNGLIAVFEYVIPFTLRDMHRYKETMLEILGEISPYCMIGDVGYEEKNYKNWGIRMVNGEEEICMLDYAYIYETSYKKFACKCDGHTLLKYDENCVNLVCPKCKATYKFSHIRRRITKQDQIEDIGDITKLGYVVDQPVSYVDANPAFTPKTEKEEKRKSKAQRQRERIKELENFDKIQLENDPYTIAYKKACEESKKHKKGETNHGKKEK